MLLVFSHAVLLGLEVDSTALALQGHTTIPQWFSSVNLVIDAWWPQVPKTCASCAQQAIIPLVHRQSDHPFFKQLTHFVVS